MNSQERTSSDSSESNHLQSDADFPEAKVLTTATGRTLLAASRMWWLTLICLLIAILMVWRSLPERGIEVSILFPEGHGLKTGDAVRYRGIDVGTVTELSLADSLDGVRVQVELNSAAANLAKAGSRFWIVRPQLSLTQVSGLETAVGAKYIAVSPGDRSSADKYEFEGLASAPPDEFHDHGLTVVLQSDRRHGITSGAPVRWRGVEVGQVLSAGLSADARHVNIAVRIRSSYRRLVRSNSKFWVTSGFNVDVGLSGLHLNADSLSTIARGGVSFITPDATGDANVRSGQIFRLHNEADDDWLGSAEATPLVDFDLPETVTISGESPSKILGITRRKSFQQHGLVTSIGSQRFLITAEIPVHDSDGQTMIPDLEVHPVSGEPVRVTEMKAEATTLTESGVLKIPLATEAAGHLDDAGVAAREQLPDELTDVVIVSTAADADQAVPIVKPLDRSSMSVSDQRWAIDADIADDLDLEQWHGAPVVSAEDGVIVGLLLVQPEATYIAPLTEPDTL